jgi:hypothetical protein
VCCTSERLSKDTECYHNRRRENAIRQPRYNLPDEGDQSPC